jgi:antitoxin component HigA of HigAB toxin-antitoxin module
VYLPRPLHDDSARDEAYAAIEPLILWQGKMTRDQEDWFHMISDLISDYDDEHEDPVPQPKPLDMLRHLVEDAHGWSGADLARFLGLHPTMGPKILRGERRLTVDHIRKLAKKFRVSVELLV